jgi:hypothetical protein
MTINNGGVAIVGKHQWLLVRGWIERRC